MESKPYIKVFHGYIDIVQGQVERFLDTNPIWSIKFVTQTYDDKAGLILTIVYTIEV